MSVAISGMGWVTPLGAGLDDVWTALMRGDRPPAGELKNPDGSRSWPGYAVDQSLVKELGRTPRLRRSSAISYFTAAAGLAALEDAGLSREADGTRRIAVILAVASGGVAYTRRFYEKIATGGAGEASPLLFPETVYNAPASHLASLLGLDGATYTLVGDATAGIAALQLGRQLIEADEADHCLVVGGEELDWILCQAYGAWRLVAAAAPAGVYAERPRGMVMSEGGSAVVLSAEGKIRVDCVEEGLPFFTRAESGDIIRRAIRECIGSEQPALVIGSANGTFIDLPERAAIEAAAPGARVFAPKALLGESLGSSALMQIIAASLALLRNEVPATPSDSDWQQLNRESGAPAGDRALVTVAGLNQQASAVALGR